jgi:transposase
VVVDNGGHVRGRRRARSTVASLTALEAAALATADPGTHLVVIVEPTGPAWLPVAVVFGRRGHTVLRVTSAKAADLRRFLARHAKSNSIDAETLARLPLVAPTGLMPVELGSPARASLDRRVRAVARLTADIGRRKTRIRALAQAMAPTIGAALSEGLNQTDLAVLERYADPRALLAAGPARLTRLIVTTSRGQLGQAKAQALRTAAAEAVALWEGDSAIAIQDLAAEVASESAWSAPPRPSEPATSSPGTPPWPASTRPGWPPACPDWARSAPPSWSPPWAGPGASGMPGRSRPSPG